MKWFVDPGEKLRVVSALAEVLDLLQLPRYAVICRSGATREILNAYEVGAARGKAAFRRVAAASGITPPGLPGFEWGAVMGQEEASARSSAAGFLEVAVASGDLVPGWPGWRARQKELVRAHLNVSQAGLPGQTLAQVILTHQLRHFAQDLGLARRPGRMLTLTARGRRLLADPGSLWRTVAVGLPGGNHFTVFAGELFLALLLAADSVPGTQIKATVGQAVAEEGFRVSRTGEPPDEHHIGWAVHETSNLCRALGLLAAGGDWRDRSYGLTGTGQAARARMLPVAPPVAPDDEFLGCTETVSSHPRTGIGVFKRDAEVGDEVGCVANLALCPEDFP